MRRLARLTIRVVDAVLRRIIGVYAYSERPDCTVRIVRARSSTERTLSDETVVRAGDPIIELHFWNEHIPRMAATGPDLRWGLRFYRATLRALRDLARYIAATPQLDDVVALIGRSSIPPALEQDSYRSLIEKLAFDFVYLPPPENTAGRILRRLENGYVRTLIWAFNPHSLRAKRRTTLQRAEMWISRRRFLERYGAADAGQPDE